MPEPTNEQIARRVKDTHCRLDRVIENQSAILDLIEDMVGHIGARPSDTAWVEDKMEQINGLNKLIEQVWVEGTEA